MATYFIKVKGKDNYIKHESQMAYTMYQEMESLGYEVEEAFVVHDNTGWSKVIPKNAKRASCVSSSTIVLLKEEDFKIDYERLSREIVGRLALQQPNSFEIDVSKHLIVCSEACVKNT